MPQGGRATSNFNAGCAGTGSARPRTHTMPAAGHRARGPAFSSLSTPTSCRPAGSGVPSRAQGPRSTL
eukprot:11241699-Alexandrium_andersonii.AAC.1